MYITVQMQREHNLLALNLGLKYGIQVPNIGGDGKCIVAQPCPLASTIAPPCMKDGQTYSTKKRLDCVVST